MVINWNKPLITVGDNSASNPTMYDLIEVYVQDADPNPKPDNKVSARPYEFEDDKAVRFSTTSPHCGQGITFHISEATQRFGFMFIGCPTTGIGIAKPIPPYFDPFRNPVSRGIVRIPGLVEQTPIEKVGDAKFNDDWKAMFSESDE